MKLSRKISVYLFLPLLLISIETMGQISWPQGQLLPTFPASASTQDLIYLNGTVAPYAKTWSWQAEATTIMHETGRLDGDGWVCQTGIDVPDKYMIYGPYDKNITSGPNIAEFRIMIDNITGNDDVIANIDVRNATTGTVLATQEITRQQFTAANSYISFKLNFQMPADSQEIELRVLWKGASYTKVDWVRITQDNANAEKYLFASLKGIVNRRQPRIFSYEGDAAAEGPYTWLQSLGINYTDNKTNTWNVLSKYLSEISGLIVYDPDQIHTVNLATKMAGDRNALIASPSLLHKLTAPPYNLPVLEDLRGKFTTKLQVYLTLFDNYWPQTDHRLLIGLNPATHKASLREYAVALGAVVIWLDPKVAEESTLLNNFLSSMPAGANYMGWWPEEQAGVTRVSSYGITTIASDFSTNLTFHSGMPRTVEPQSIPAKPTLENKIYVAFIISDGDNLQYVEHLMRKLWKNADRGSVPIGWTLSPAMIDAMPGALNYYHKTSTINDNLISGPSGYGYTYPNNWSSATALNDYVAKTEDYNARAGFRVITIWNTITGGINQNVGKTFADFAPTLLGLTAQNTGGALSIYNYTLPGMPLSCNYCTGEQAMKDHINTASKGWNGASPRFVIIQAQPWNNVTPTSFKNVKNSLGTNYVVVRPDHIFQLIREANGLSVNPGGIEGNGTGLTGTYFNGMNFETEVATQINAGIDFNWGTGAPVAGVNADAFSVRWTGQIQPRYSGKYTFYTTCDNGARLWINNELVIDQWNGTPGLTYTGSITLTAGQKYNIKAEYFESDNQANCKLEWASAFQSREVIPYGQLYKDTAATGIENLNALTGIKVYPNPSTQGLINIETENPDGDVINLTVYDICGKALFNQNIMEEKQQLNVSGLSKGIYLLSFRTKKYVKTIQYVID